MAELLQSRYRLDRPLGKGGMGEVFAATDLRLGREVAIKFCLGAATNPGARHQIEREARAASRLTHPNIGTIYDYEEDTDGRPFIVMELLNGESLVHQMERGPLPVAEALHVARDVARALGAAHNHGVLHRDIKPSNILRGESGEVKVLDFGLAHLCVTEAPGGEGQTLSAPGTIVGTPAYMSPEQAVGEELTPASDLFSLGTLLYRMLTGVNPFEAATAGATLLRVNSHDPAAPSKLNPEVPPEVDAITMRLLQKEPEARPENAEEVAQALNEALGKLRPAGVQAARVSRQHVWQRVAVALGLVAVTWFGWQAYLSHRNTVSPEARRWYEEGLRATREGTFWRASKSLGEAVRMSPAFTVARVRLADALLELDDAQRARKEMLMALTPWPGRAPLSKAEATMVSAVQSAVSGQHAAAVEQYQKLTQNGSAADRGQAWFDLARALERAQKQEDAASAYQSAMSADASVAAGSHVRLGRLLARKGKFAAAMKELDEAERLYAASANVEGQGEVELQRAFTNNRDRRADAARASAKKGIDLARAAGNPQLEVRCLLQLSSTETKEGNLGEAQKAADEAVSAARASGASGLVTRAMIEAGILFLTRGKYEEAESSLKAALEAAREQADALQEARALANLASVYDMKGLTAESLRCAQEALRYYTQNGRKRDALPMMAIVSRGYATLGQADDASRSFSELRAAAVKESDRYSQVLALEGLAMVAEMRGQFRAASDQFREAGGMSRADKQRQRAAYSAVAEAEAEIHLGNANGASALLDAVKPYAQAEQDRGLQGKIAVASAQLALMRGDVREAQREAEAFSKLASSGPNAAHSALEIHALLAARSGKAGSVIAACDQAIEAADAERVAAESHVRLSCMEAYVAARSGARAAPLAAEVGEACERMGNRECAWRAWAFAAMAQDGHGNGRTRARSNLEMFEGSLAPHDLATYRSRRDLARLRASLR